MCSETAATDGLATERTIQHYARLASSGAGLVLVEYAFVHPSGRSEDNQLGIASDLHAEALRPVLAAIRQSGAKAGLQITHSGAKSARTLTGGKLMSPSGIPVPVKDQDLEVPDIMSTTEIDAWRTWFVAAAGRAVSLGFDAIELHAAHGYGLNQWISPITNRRLDRYGGNERHRLLGEIVTTIRAQHPDVLLSVRMPGRDFSEGGLDVNDTTALAKALEDLGVDLIHVSSGIGGWRRPSSRTGEGYLVDEAREIQRHVSAPVIGVGGIESSRYIEEGLAEGWFRLAAVGRAILTDPCAWGERNLSRACQPL